MISNKCQAKQQVDDAIALCGMEFFQLAGTPYSLNPTHFTLNPTPYTLHTSPSTLHPKPYTPHPTKPYALRPKL